MARLSAVLITLNESRNIKACLESLSFCDEQIVVDSGSTDGTQELAKSIGAKVYERPFDDFASQKNFAISKATGEWVLLVDADERISESLREEIKSKILFSSADGFELIRHNQIFGRWMKYGINYQDAQLRLVKKSKAVFSGAVHERVILDKKPEQLKSPLLHYSTESISDYMRKLNAYTGLETRRMTESDPSQIALKMKRRPLLRLIQLIFLKRAFLDGLEGIFFALLSAYYDFISLAKHWEKSTKEI